MDTGDYQYHCVWEVFSQATPDAKGARAETYTAQSQTLWVSIENLTSNQDTELKDRRNTTRATIKIRGWPSVSKNDRLVEGQFGNTWVIESLYRDRDNYQLVCQAYVFDGVRR